MTESNRYVLTIATGKKLYVDLAANLARSFLWWHKGSDIRFQLVTDQQALVPADILPQVDLIAVAPGELGQGFSAKLFLDRLVRDGQTLFIDSDCLVFGNLDSVFERFKGKPVSVVGNYISNGEWFGDVGQICARFNVPHIPKFNGGIYYLEKGLTASSVYDTARDLEKQYDEIGFVRLRNRPNDEVIMAVAMQLHKQSPLIDDGTIMSDPQSCPGRYQLDVIKGTTLMINPPKPHPDHRDWNPFEKLSPLIVHFLGAYTHDYPYKREVYKLKKALRNNLNLLSKANSLLVIEYPDRIKNFLKDTFRATFHRLFGVRKIKPSDRIVE